MSNWNAMAQLANAEKHGRKLVCCIYCKFYKNGRCQKFNEKKAGNDNCIHGVAE